MSRLRRRQHPLSPPDWKMRYSSNRIASTRDFSSSLTYPPCSERTPFARNLRKVGRDCRAAGVCADEGDSSSAGPWPSTAKAVQTPWCRLSGAPLRADRGQCAAAWSSPRPSAAFPAMVIHALSQQAGITVPAARLLELESDHRTFACQRFDRLPNGRRFFVSAMTLLGKNDGDGGSYLDLAEFLSTRGSASKARPSRTMDTSGLQPSRVQHGRSPPQPWLHP